MKPFEFQVALRNRSDWPIDLVWENAQDLEHVAFLHRRTNVRFRLLDVVPCPRGERPYGRLTYLVVRRLFGFLPVTVFGFRRIAGDFEIHQVDISPLLGVTTALRSRLEQDPSDPSKTLLLDDVTVSMPALLRPLRTWVEAALRRHTRIQCAEDEPYRARRHDLRERGIRLPASLLNSPLSEEVFT